MRSLTASSAPALFRTTAKTPPTWPQWKVQLTRMAQETHPLRVWRDGKISPLFWESDPIAQNLDFILRCFPGHKCWAAGARAGCHTTRPSGRILPDPADCSYCKKSATKLLCKSLLESWSMSSSAAPRNLQIPRAKQAMPKCAQLRLHEQACTPTKYLGELRRIKMPGNCS